MATNVFVSFDHDDQSQINGFRSLVKNPNHPLDFHDHSLKEPVRDWTGKIVKYKPSDPRSKPVRDNILGKFQKASKMVVLIGNNTLQSEWVKWEVDSFYQIKSGLPGETWKRIRGMKLKNCDNAAIPDALLNGRSTVYMNWDPAEMDKWIEQDPNK